MRDPACVFCAIAAGETEAERVLEEDDFVAFLDQRPVFKGHVLLVTRDHVVTLPDLPAGLRDDFLAAAQRLATAVVDGLGAQGSFVAMNNVFGKDTRYVSNIGLSQIAAGQFLHVYKERNWINCGQAGPLGWTVPAALGVRAADPTSPIPNATK